MRGPVLVASIAAFSSACFAPQPAAGLPCSPDSACPSGQVCIDGTCEDGCAGLTAQGSTPCVITPEAEAWCWGYNEFGEVGDGTRDNREVPVRVAVPGRVSSVFGGEHHTCAVADGAVYCWGQNDLGQVGDGTTTLRTTPTRVGVLTGAVAVAIGEYHGCALLADGTVSCWGDNDYGALGDGTFTDRMTPGPVLDLADARSLAVGDDLGCVVRDDDAVWCWGSGSNGKLGDGGLEPSREVPGIVPGLSGVVQVSAGCHQHVCAVTAAGAVWCWGQNQDGQIGDGTVVSPRDVPTRVAVIADAVQVAVGASHTCALTGAGRVYCWGDNEQGELGNGEIGVDASVPVEVDAFADVPAVEITTGCSVSCALRADHTVWCWGNGTDGAMGEGAFEDRDVPVRARAPC